jgi:hypothetical protein
MRSTFLKLGISTALAAGLLTAPAAGNDFLGNPEQANCHGQTISEQARSHGGASKAAAEHGFASTQEGQEFVRTFCGTGNR